jgi:hypothetical protein
VWGELLLVAFGLSVTSLVGWAVVRRRPGEGRATPPPREPAGGRWIAADPLGAASPVERTRRERAVGDAAFVDGFIIGRYVATGERAEVEHARTAGSRDTEAGAGRVDPSDADDLDEGSGSDGFGSDDGFDVDDGFASDDGFDVDDGFGSDDGFDVDDDADDW